MRILTANGPQGGSLADVKKLDTVIVGVDQVAIDSFGATLFGMKGSDLGYVRLGHKRGIGQMDLGKADVSGTCLWRCAGSVKGNKHLPA